MCWMTTQHYWGRCIVKCSKDIHHNLNNTALSLCPISNAQHPKFVAHVVDRYHTWHSTKHSGLVPFCTRQQTWFSSEQNCLLSGDFLTYPNVYHTYHSMDQGMMLLFVSSWIGWCIFNRLNLSNWCKGNCAR